MRRETLPNRRETTGVTFDHDGQKYTAHFGQYPDGRIAEVFVSGMKIGTSVDTGAREASTILSMALQFGAAFESIRRALPRDPSGKAMGPIGAIMDLLHGDAENGRDRGRDDQACSAIDVR